MTKLRLSIVLMIVPLFLFGCTKETSKDGKVAYKLNPIISEKIEAPIEAGGKLLEALGPYIPYASTAGLALLSALGIYRTTVKPKFVAAKTEANLFHTGMHTVVMAIEDVKKKEPELWSKLEPFLDSRIGTITDNIIRGLRGLPPKE